jgi:uracil-DNA glycosylase family 4
MVPGKRLDLDPADLLLFYVEAGVDIALSEEPVDRFALSRAQAAEGARKREAVRQPPVSPMRETVNEQRPTAPDRPPATAAPEPRQGPIPNLAIPSEAVVMAAREAAATAATLDELRATLATFEGCNLRFTATNLVFADGNPEARVMFVGEAPGMEEDLQGLPFVGRSGKLLDRMIAAIGLDRTSAYIANAVPWRPPGNRTPTPQETEICRPFIERQIQLADPDFLVPLGGASAKQLLKTNEGILRLRGQWRSYDTGTRTIPAMATLHPAYLLRQPLQKKLVWRDLLSLKEKMEGR